MRRLLTAALALVLLCGCILPAAQAAPEEEAAAETIPRSLTPAEEARIALLAKGERELLDDLAFGRVQACEAVDPSWFDDAAFVGDSVSVMLEYYNNSLHPLGNAAFFCAESLSARNILNAQAGSERLPEWPKGSGEHPLIPDAIAAFGAKKVYIMLGMNSISGGVDNAAADLVTLVDSISRLSPEAVILIQPTTPMMATSPRADDKLNNRTIRQYDLVLAQLCREKGWYYVDAAQALGNEQGALRTDYSGDKAMGIHLNFAGTEAWAEYLRTHVPRDLL